MPMLQQLPLGMSTFSDIIQKNYLYVDKTEHIHRLITSSKYYFLSRPRRFGKSLMVSTLKEIFEGHHTLFKDLWIGQCGYEFPKHPVINLDFGGISHGTPEAFEEGLRFEISSLAKKNAIQLPPTQVISTLFKVLVTELAQSNQAVLLVDEYDKPILDHLHDPKTAESMRTILHGFFSTVKGLDAHWRFIFLTGVSKFSKTSVFSGLNNLTDLSENSLASTALGYTQEELTHYFQIYVQELATQLKVTDEQAWQTLKTWYNGYRFSPDSTEKVYNPFSILHCLNQKKISNYWFESGTPSFLIKIAKQQDIGKFDYEDCQVSASAFSTFDLDSIRLIPAFYQTGYLTLKEVDEQDNIYHLGFPNQEVRDSMSGYLAANLVHADKEDVDFSIGHIRKALRANNVEAFVELLQSLFANIPARLHIPEERYYHSLFQLICNLLGVDAHSEINTSKGVIDVVIELPIRIFVIEIKLGHTAQIAFKQIRDKHYADKYKLKQKPITLVGLSFRRTTDGSKIESVSQG